MPPEQTSNPAARVQPKPLSESERPAYAEAMRQTEAIFALEGMYPTEQDKAITAAILDGRVSPEQAREELMAYLRANKTGSGFIESREWAKQHCPMYPVSRGKRA